MKKGSLVVGRKMLPPIGSVVTEKDGRVYKFFPFGWVRIA